MARYDLFFLQIKNAVTQQEPSIYINWINTPTMTLAQTNKITQHLLASGYKADHPYSGKKDASGNYVRQPQEVWTR